jgi:hypothetical protein
VFFIELNTCSQRPVNSLTVTMNSNLAYEFMQKMYNGLCKQFPRPDYHVMVRGSWAVFLHAYQSGKFSDQQITEISPQDLDIFL